MLNSRQATTREFLDSLTRVSRKLRTVFNARVMEHGLTYARARALLRLSRRSALTQKELACELELEQPTTGRLLDRMEKLDLIERVLDPHDRRAKQIMLTAHGAAQADLVARISDQIREEIFAGIPEEDIGGMISILGAVEKRVGGADVRHVRSAH